MSKFRLTGRATSCKLASADASHSRGNSPFYLVPRARKTLMTPADRFFRALVRLVLRVFFREVEVAGAERLPAGRPLVLLANHVNGLIDPLLLIGPLLTVEPPPRFLGKSTLWQNPARPPLPRARRRHPRLPPAGRRGGPGEERRDLRPLPRAAGEGGDPRPLPGRGEPQRSRPAAAQDRRRPHRPRGREEVPGARHPHRAGRLLFDGKETFRSRALVQVGEPLDPAPEIALAATATREAAARALTARIDDALRQVTLSYDTWEDARLIAPSPTSTATAPPSCRPAAPSPRGTPSAAPSSPSSGTTR